MSCLDEEENPFGFASISEEEDGQPSEDDGRCKPGGGLPPPPPSPLLSRPSFRGCSLTQPAVGAAAGEFCMPPPCAGDRLPYTRTSGHRCTALPALPPPPWETRSPQSSADRVPSLAATSVLVQTRRAGRVWKEALATLGVRPAHGVASVRFPHVRTHCPKRKLN